MVFVCVLLDNSNRINNVTISQLVNKDFPGVDKLVKPYLVHLETHLRIHVDVVRLLCMNAQPVLIGMDIDVSILLVSVQQVCFGRTSVARLLINQFVLKTLIWLMVYVNPSLVNVLEAWPGITLDVILLLTLVPLALTIME